MALAAYLVYEKRVGRTLESRQGDAAINEQENKPKEDAKPGSSKRAGLTRLLGIVLLVAAALFWVAAVALGSEVFRRYRRFLDPRDWFSNKRF
jgi:drug/metabolite transporter (DMT)-like permease